MSIIFCASTELTANGFFTQHVDPLAQEKHADFRVRRWRGAYDYGFELFLVFSSADTTRSWGN